MRKPNEPLPCPISKITPPGYWASIELLAPRFAQLARAARPALVQREAVEDLDWELALR